MGNRPREVRRTIGAYDDPATASDYDKRPSTTRAELRVAARLLGERGRGEKILDVPCGRGRLGPFLRSLSPESLVGADGSRAMLTGGRETHDIRLVADAGALPFPSREFGIVVCMRLLHHFSESADRIAILSELARVSADLVLVSYYESRSLEGMRRRWRRKRPSGRVGIPAAGFRADLAAAGLSPLRRASLLPLVREQNLVLAKTLLHSGNLG